MERVLAVGVAKEHAALDVLEIERRPVGPHDVYVRVLYCGVCHSDLHHGRSEWGRPKFPAVPGHEIIGQVVRVGSDVSKFRVDDTVGVGVFVDSCRHCSECKDGQVQYCSGKRAGDLPGRCDTYGSPTPDPPGHTLGGYSQAIVVDENYVLSIPPGLDLKRAAPLLCAGITTYSAMRHYGVRKGDRIGVLGLGGLGHMAVKFGKAMGAHVTVLTRSSRKRDLAMKMGADDVIITEDEGDRFKAAQRSMDRIVDTVSARHDIDAYVNLLRVNGTLIMVGASPDPLTFRTFPLIMRRTSIGGSLVGGIAETQEMLQFCADHDISCDVEVVPIADVNKAWDRMVKGDVQFRFVIDVAGSLAKGTTINKA
ncbi:unnamed protein product (mitochondrion) [Plasmodiophora brassicae]|uniref:Enoyl reductase (ER) domain-containing protein n=1 Tax=Plasmodiophora brassicae TaxID=37360 RepID=A0A0G4IHA4_PLABS|nr:hypothetical protein PBRA_000361 [Plasmodiophora brassicae]SPQ96921.1 unnamed protein product [Plasmodiophora brassicae]